MEIRLYYECLEQANNFIKPYITKALKDSNIVNVPISLVKRPRRANQFEKGSLFAIQSLITADALITGISNGIEYPLILIEFSEAVSTEDHELQRTYGAIAAHLANCFYLKISGNKKSDKVFGGAEYNPYSSPRIFLDELNYKGYILADWATDSSNENLLLRNMKFSSCPAHIQIIEDTILCAVKSFQNASDIRTSWYKHAISMLEKSNSYKEFYSHIKSAKGASDLLSSWNERDKRKKNKNSVRYFVTKQSVAAKINRFNHAMDPDRGILTFLSFVFSKSHTIIGIYALVRQRTPKLKEDLNDLNDLKAKLNIALKKDETGIPKWFIKGLKDMASKALSVSQTIEIDDFWEKNRNKIASNKVVMTIAYFLDELHLNHNGIKLKWNRHKLIGNTKNDFLNAVRNFFKFNDHISATPIEKITSEIDEDEVTYTIIHKVLLPNNFKIVFVSYPGAQGGGAVLPEPLKGKSQPREYPDVIALPPEYSGDIDVFLNESKGMFAKTKIEKDLEKILRYKNIPSVKNALNTSLRLANVVSPDKSIKKIIIGVSFGTKKGKKTLWQPNDVDFILRITDREHWSIGIFNQALRDLIPNIEGKTDFPVVFKISSKK